MILILDVIRRIVKMTVILKQTFDEKFQLLDDVSTIQYHGDRIRFVYWKIINPAESKYVKEEYYRSIPLDSIVHMEVHE